MKKELGITVSVGVSFNKIFAKLGSDYKKPDAITTMNKDEYKEKAWRTRAARTPSCSSRFLAPGIPPVQQQSKSTATQHPTTRVPEKKIVDTRKVTNVNLDKYDEKLQDMAERIRFLQPLHRIEHMRPRLARNPQRPRLLSARRQQNRIIMLHQTVQRTVAAKLRMTHEVDAELQKNPLQTVHIGTLQTELRNAVTQHPADPLHLIVDRHCDSVKHCA